ncbi:hypothetical protein CEUSTIGMA_g12232.t1 [Chlamydomonas eustigma]|uniref:Biotin-protein ligase N-terminal domain-containing protein n=1 Tax=Chlamydomonas eustigma TaxID=1157962 RepID=A0A250XP11_9CHLO|nr:hypothetical protein CEUSTIGMA_g12232.t1 [Chlamydomonas eustigma]|eukprot:GAX84811.1 hypothetical protein CEUSTIGMA_g12232.t1 [Chlamydomonas eustigma]
MLTSRTAIVTNQTIKSGDPHARALIYNGDGSGIRSALSLKESLNAVMSTLGVQVDFIGTEELLAAKWTEPSGGCVLFCMPGDWVEGGGAYLGLCAGAYYASSRCIFEPQDAVLGVVGNRELSFFPGHAQGAVFPGFDYRSERGAVAAPLRFRSLEDLIMNETEDSPGDDKEITVLTRPTAHGEATALSVKRARLARAILKDRNVEECATTDPPSSLYMGHSLLGQTRCRNTWKYCFDYSNGGPMFVNHLGEQDLSCYHDQSQVEVLAEYLGEEGDGRHGYAAALRCKVGAGVAVLCGTHPELHHRWLRHIDNSDSREFADSSMVSQEGSGLGSSQEHKDQQADKAHLSSMAPPCVESRKDMAEGTVKADEGVEQASDGALSQTSGVRQSYVKDSIGRCLKEHYSGRLSLWQTLLYTSLSQRGSKRN